MPLATLLNPNDPLFVFEHMMQTQALWTALTDTAGYSVLPYLLDPAYDTAIPASKWHLNHQQSHDDFNAALPAEYGSTQIGIPQGAILLDSNLKNPDQLTWWTFINHQEHYIANSSI
jgi:hypothetical protein